MIPNIIDHTLEVLLSDKIKVDLSYEGNKGVIVCECDKVCEGIYKIWIYKYIFKLKRFDVVEYICHECVHIAQDYLNRFEYLKDNQYRFDGKIYECDTSKMIPYVFSPWEIEANGYGRALAHLYFQEK